MGTIVSDYYGHEISWHMEKFSFADQLFRVTAVFAHRDHRSLRRSWRIPYIVGPDILLTGCIEIDATAVISALRVVDGAYLVAGSGAARLLPGVDGVATSGEQVVGNTAILLDAKIFEEADRVGLGTIIEN